ncbi:hypothetical protein AB0C18_12835 [Nonomuraea muscovyensis]|uniref:hypothetical protein n=1 Tax=Nonomuraea muscovyensis TaxID=1124761 RepID=UPI0033D6A2D0
MIGYSYTTILVRPDEEPRIAVAIHPDERTRVEYYPAKEDSHAFPRVEYGPVAVTIGTRSQSQVTDEHVWVARQLFDAAAGFLADCERLRAAA